MALARLVGTIVLGLLGVAAAEPAMAGKKDNTLVWATDRENAITDSNYLNTRELVVLGHYVYDTLVVIDAKDGQLRPLLATKWTWVDDKTLDMDLRPDVKFHDGSPFSAEDAAYTLSFLSDKQNASLSYSLLDWIKNAEAVDKHKLRINLARPFPPALAYLAGVGFIYKKGHYDAAPMKPDGKKDFGAVKANGTGPYMVTDIKPGESITATKFAGYFKDGYKGTPSIDKIVFRTIKDETTRLAELMTGKVDWVWDVPKDQAERLKANSALVVENAKTLRISYIQFDARGTSGFKHFMDKRVRRAVAHAINREAIAKNLVGPASVVIHSACHPDQFGCSSDVTKYEYNPDKARQLLAEAGLAGGFEADLYGYRERGFTEAVIGDLARVGIKAKLNWLQYSSLGPLVQKGQTPFNHMTWGSSSVPDVSACASHFFGGESFDMAKDPEVIKLIKAADMITDPEKRKAAWRTGLERIADEAYWVPLFTYAKYYVWSRDLVFAPTSDEIPPFFAARWK